MSSPTGAIQAVTVYCSSSKSVERHYFEAAGALGRAIASAGWRLVYGGNAVGMMASLADGARQAGGKVIGITPQLLVDKGIADEKCDELIITDDMRQRKALMEQRGDAFIALPGGIGTLEEVFEIFVARHLGYHAKPIVLLNVANYYAPLLKMLEHGLEQRFIRKGAEQLLFVTDRVEAAIAHLRPYHAPAPASPLAGQAWNSAIE